MCFRGQMSGYGDVSGCCEDASVRACRLAVRHGAVCSTQPPAAARSGTQRQRPALRDTTSARPPPRARLRRPPRSPGGRAGGGEMNTVGRRQGPEPAQLARSVGRRRCHSEILLSTRRRRPPVRNARTGVTRNSAPLDKYTNISLIPGKLFPTSSGS